MQAMRTENVLSSTDDFRIMPGEDLARYAARFYWYHCIDLGQGVVTEVTTIWRTTFPPIIFRVWLG
jgi:hypothetical protein